MQSPLRRRTCTVMLLLCAALLSSCESSSGWEFGVGLPTHYGGAELGMATSNWVGGPFWD